MCVMLMVSMLWAGVREMAHLYCLSAMVGFSHCWGSKEGRKEQCGISACSRSTLIHLSFHLSVPYVSVFLVNFLSLHPSICHLHPSLPPSLVHSFIHLSALSLNPIPPSVHLSICLCLCLSIHLFSPIPPSTQQSIS